MHIFFHMLKAFQLIILCSSNTTTGMEKTGQKGVQIFRGVLPSLVSPDTTKTAEPLLYSRVASVWRYHKQKPTSFWANSKDLGPAPARIRVAWQETINKFSLEHMKNLVLFGGDTEEGPLHKKWIVTGIQTEVSCCIQEQSWWSLKDCPRKEQRQQLSKEAPPNTLPCQLFVLHSVQMLHPLTSTLHLS